MRPALIPTLVLTMVLPLGCTRGSGVQGTEVRAVETFEAIDVGGGAITVKVQVGPQTHVEVQGDDNIVPKVRTEVQGATLHVELPGSTVTKLPLVVQIAMPSLKEFEISGASTADIHGIEGEQLEIDVDGASTARLHGEVATLDAEVSGASTLRAAELTAKTIDVDADGASTAEVHASESLDANASGASTIRYHGQPATLERNASGSSTVEAAG